MAVTALRLRFPERHQHHPVGGAPTSLRLGQLEVLDDLGRVLLSQVWNCSSSATRPSEVRISRPLAAAVAATVADRRELASAF
jgi:hypothetical protein